MAGSAGRRISDAIEGGSTTIDGGIRIEGTITGSVPIDVSGTVEGTVEVDALVWLRQGAKVKGQIVAHSVVVEGQLHGTIKAKERVELRATCKVHGDVDATTVAIAEGAFFDGRIRMSGSGEAPKSFQEKRRSES